MADGEGASASPVDAEDLGVPLAGTPAERCLDAVRKGMLPKLEVSFALCKDDDIGAVDALLRACDPMTVTELRITECVQMHKLPKRLLNLSRLTVLSLRGAVNLGLRPEEAEEEIAPGILPPNPNMLPPLSTSLFALQELDLSGCISLERLPDDVCDLHDLTTLRLAGCTSLVQLPANLGGAVEPEDAPPPPADAEGDAEAGAPAVRIASFDPIKKLSYLDLGDCERLLQLPDMSKLGDQLVVNLDGVKMELQAAWQRAGRGAVSAAFL